MATTLTLQQMREDLAALLRTDAAEIADDDNLLDHGLDSIRLMRLAQQWNDQGIAVSFAALAERPELLHWARLVAEASAQAPSAAAPQTTPHTPSPSSDVSTSASPGSERPGEGPAA